MRCCETPVLMGLGHSFSHFCLANSVLMAPELRPYVPKGIMIAPFGHPFHGKDGQQSTSSGGGGGHVQSAIPSGRARSATQTKAGAPYRYSETLIMPAAALRVGMGVRHRQLEGAIGKMIGESRTPHSSQLRKRMGGCVGARFGPQLFDITADAELVLGVCIPSGCIVAGSPVPFRRSRRGGPAHPSWSRHTGQAPTACPSAAFPRLLLPACSGANHSPDYRKESATIRFIYVRTYL